MSPLSASARVLLLAALSVPTVALASGSTPAGSTPADDAPVDAAAESVDWNVLILTVDALRADRMGLYGHDRDTTPWLERFAEESVVFEQCFANGAWTSPGMVSVFTGMHPPVHGQATRFDYVDERLVTPIDVLAKERRMRTIARDTDSATYRGAGFQWAYRPARTDPVEVTEWLAGLDDRRWLAWIHIKPTHLPYDPPPFHLRRFGGDRLDTPAIRAVRSSGTVYPKDYGLSWDPPVIESFTDEEKAVVRDLYDGEVAHADDVVGRMIEALRASGELDRTLVILTADHGDELFEHGWVGHASTGYQGKVYDELTHIPLIIRVPGGRSGRVDALVQQSDLMPTIFELLDVEPTFDGRFQGTSLVPALRGEAQTPHEHVFSRTTFKGWTTPWEETRDGATAIRDRSRKLIRYRRDGEITHEAFDLEADPGEQEDLFEAAPERFVDLVQAMDAWEADNVEAAAELLFAAAGRRVQALEEAAREGDGVSASREWLALVELERTYANEWSPPQADRRYRAPWMRLMRRARVLRDKATR